MEGALVDVKSNMVPCLFTRTVLTALGASSGYCHLRSLGPMYPDTQWFSPYRAHGLLIGNETASGSATEMNKAEREAYSKVYWMVP